MIEHVFDRLHPQVGQIIISANKNLDKYSQLGCPVIEDELAGHPGPLAGIAAALSACETQWLLVTACDTPNIPMDLAVRLFKAVENNPSNIELAYPHDGEQSQHLFMLIHKTCLSSLEEDLKNNQYRVMQWLSRQRSVKVDFSDCASAFININRPKDLQS